MIRQTRDGWNLARARKVGLLLLIPAGMWAAGPPRVEKTIETTVNPRISVYNLAGKVVVRGWDKSQIHVVYAPSSSNIAVDMDQLPNTGPVDKVRFTTYLVNRSVAGQDTIVDYTLQVPAGASLEIRNPQGGVEVNAIQGDTSVDSLGADISVADAGGHLSVRSVGGSIIVTRASGRVEAYSINGALHFVDTSSAKLRGNTTSGDITYEGGFVPGGDYILSDYSGNIDIVCPATASFELNAKTVRGKLENQFPLVSRPSMSPLLSSANSIFGTHSTGEATLELTSFSGAIRIRQQ